MITDNEVLVNNFRELPALMCEQSSAAKIVPTEEDFINSNISGFGNDIGKITNRITSMYELQYRFPEDSKEYKELEYRICCGQLQQQDCIDKIKGIISKPMPREWYDPNYVRKIEDPEKRKLYSDILAFRKPYFMRYIYPAMSRKYSSYEKKTNRNAMRHLGITLSELTAKSVEDMSEEEFEFYNKYSNGLPLGNSKCVMNIISKIFEDLFDKTESRRLDGHFDYSIFKSNTEYSDTQYKSINKLYIDYNHRLKSYMTVRQYEKIDSSDAAASINIIRSEFLAECVKICPNKKALCDIVLDMTYRNEYSKGFAWDMCGDDIIDNLMNKYGNKLSFPVHDDDGDIYYCGSRYSVCEVELEDYYDNVIERAC